MIDKMPHRVTIRISSDMRDRMKECANRELMTLADWIRETLKVETNKLGKKWTKEGEE